MGNRRGGGRDDGSVGGDDEGGAHGGGTHGGERVLVLCDVHPHCVGCGCPLSVLSSDAKRISCISCIEAGRGVEPEDIAARPMRTGEV